MVGRRGMRAAAVLMAGMVGVALVAPGLASAQETTTTEPAPSSSTPTTTPTTTPPLPSLPSAPAEGPSAASPALEPAPDASSSSESATSSDGDTTAAEGVASVQRAAGAFAAENELEEPSAAALALPGLTIPQLPGAPEVPASEPPGGFTNPQEGCLFFGSQIPAEGAPADLGQQIAEFCATLPTSFEAPGLGGLEDLIAMFEDLLAGLMPMDQTGTVDESVPAGYVAPEYAPYMSGASDFNCGDLDSATAQALYAQDTSDPHQLDADSDGNPCETGNVAYSGFPQGGVATGDSDPAFDAAHSGSLAIALVMTAGFAAAGAARRRDRDDELAGV